jgi:hypothetical protein
MTKSDILKNIPDAGGMNGKNCWEAIVISEIPVSEGPFARVFANESSNHNPLLEKQEQNRAKVKRVLFYAGIAVVIGIVAFIIIKKHKK